MNNSIEETKEDKHRNSMLIVSSGTHSVSIKCKYWDKYSSVEDTVLKALKVFQEMHTNLNK